MASMAGERIAKRLARAGLCSRREAEVWIRAGRVAVDGKVLDTPAFTVTDANAVTVDGKPLAAPEPTRLWRYHKPAGLVTTNRDPQGRPTVFESLPADLPRVVSIGRLDLGSEGLLLLTNDGELARKLELPATGWLRRYRVRVRGKVDPDRLVALSRGIEIDGMRYGPIRAALDRQMPNNAWLTVALAEGKNREVRRVCEHLGLPVLRLIRLSYGPFQLGLLEPGAVEHVPARVLREQLGEGTEKAKVGTAKSRKKPFPANGRGGKKPRPAHISSAPAGGGPHPEEARSAVSKDGEGVDARRKDGGAKKPGRKRPPKTHANRRRNT